MPRQGEVRKAPSGRTFYVQQPNAPGNYTEPMTYCVEVEGRWAGCQFTLPTEALDQYQLVSAPVEEH